MAPRFPALVALLTTLLAFAEPPKLPAKPLPLPGSPGKVTMDYLAFDSATSHLWVPAGNGKVNIIDTHTLAITSIDGFPTAVKGERMMGPSSVSLTAGFAYVGNRANSQVCAIDAKANKLGGCVELKSPPDGVAFVGVTQEVWVTTPHDSSLTLLDVSAPSAPKLKQVLKLEGEPEGYAVDEGRGRFYTNLEDQDATLAFDVKTRKQVARWEPHCGKEGPRGMALDLKRQLLVVACTNKVVVVNVGKDGAKGGELLTGAGVDNISYVSALHQVYVASGQSSTLSIAELKDDATLTLIATASTAEGARVVMADDQGTAFVADSAGGRLLVVQAAAKTEGKK